MSFHNGEKFLVLDLYFSHGKLFLVLEILNWKWSLLEVLCLKHELVDNGEWMVIGDCHSECALTMDLYTFDGWDAYIGSQSFRKMGGTS
jgi:hypothetical protein